MNYGLSGIGEEQHYDDFLCFGRKCKQRRKERHAARMAKKKAKTDAQKADTERVRAETGILKKTVSGGGQTTAVTMPLTKQSVRNPQEIAGPQNASSGPQKAGVGTAMVVVIVSLVGGFLLMKNRRPSQ